MEAVSAVNQTLPISGDETVKFTTYSAAVHKVIVMVNAGILGILQLMSQQSSVLETHKAAFLSFFFFRFILRRSTCPWSHRCAATTRVSPEARWTREPSLWRSSRSCARVRRLCRVCFRPSSSLVYLALRRRLQHYTWNHDWLKGKQIRHRFSSVVTGLISLESWFVYSWVWDPFGIYPYKNKKSKEYKS